MSEDTGRADGKPASEDRLSTLWRRVRDHKLVQWTVAYVALAYGIQHGVTSTSEAFDWPHAVERVSMLLLALGLPLVMTLAWYHGAHASRRVSGAELSIISLLLVGISVLFYVFARPMAETASAPAQQASFAAARTASLNASTAIAIAVMPFANLSSDKDQEFFSDGMTDEIAGALAKVPDLRIVARSSAFQFKGQNKEARSIGQALGATHLIEGSVRQAGNRVRISAQLVRADNGLQIWSENYDREMTDVFAIQEDIARAITASLRMPLGLRPGENLVNNRGIDSDFYQQYLRARGFLRAFDADNAQPILEAIVGRNPDFTPAWVLLAQVYSFTRGAESGIRAGPLDEQKRRARNDGLDREEHAAREAVRLDLRYAGGYAALASVQMFRGMDWAGSEDLFRRALTLDPNDDNSLISYALFLNSAGRLKQALSTAEQMRALDPLVPLYNFMVAYLLQLNGDNQRSIPMLEALPRAGVQGYFRDVALASAYALAGRYPEAADTLASIPPQSLVSRKSIDDAVRLLRSAPAKIRDPAALPVLEGELRLVYLFIGAPDRAFDYAERTVEIGAVIGTGFRGMWEPVYAPLRKTERFKALVSKAGLVDYWKARGWPDLCRPVGADDFACN